MPLQLIEDSLVATAVSPGELAARSTSSMTVTRTTAFQRTYDALQAEVKRAVDRTIGKPAVDPTRPGLQVHRVTGTQGSRILCCRASQELRLGYVKVDGGLLLMAVGSHDDVYKEAEDWRASRAVLSA